MTPTNVLLVPFFTLLIYGVAFNEGPIATFFSLPLLVLLGEASYALYLLHFPINDWLSHIVTHFHISRNPYVTQTKPYFLAYVAISITASILTFRYVKEPARKAIKRAFARRALPQRHRQKGPTRGSVDLPMARGDPSSRYLSGATVTLSTLRSHSYARRQNRLTVGFGCPSVRRRTDAASTTGSRSRSVIARTYSRPAA